MQQQQINLSPDIEQLIDEGYQIEVKGGHILAHHIPYLNSHLEVKYGTLVAIITMASPTRIGQPADHTIYFCGEIPYNADGTALNAIINNSNKQNLTEDIIVDHYFSSRPRSGNYINYYDKIRTYCEILSSQAREKDKSVTLRPNKKKTS